MRESAEFLSAKSCPRYENATRLNFGFSLLELEDFDTALEQAVEVLASKSRPLQRKSALYLAGEAYSYLGLADLAREYFVTLQQEFYPHTPSLVDTLQAVRTHRLVTWFA